MTTVTLIPPQSPPVPPPVVYHSSDGEPWAETSTHLDSDVLTLRLVVEGELIGFYRDDTGEKLLVPDELYVALKQEVAARQAAEERASKNASGQSKNSSDRHSLKHYLLNTAIASESCLNRVKVSGIISGVSEFGAF